MRLRVIYVLIGVLGIAANTSLGQDKGTMRGMAIDSTSRESLPFANIFVNNTTIGTSADQNGEFELKNLPPGFNDVVFSYVGYHPRIIRFYIAEGATISAG
ncbi:MAG: carboxypeptidase-like regulatory domain-containing protein, partial [Cyclobacteriaceae bacterium]